MLLFNRFAAFVFKKRSFVEHTRGVFSPEPATASPGHRLNQMIDNVTMTTTPPHRMLPNIKEIIAKALEPGNIAYNIDLSSDIPSPFPEHLRQILSIQMTSGRERYEHTKRAIIKAYGRDLNDTGSPEVQSAIMSLQIYGMSEHMANHRKDMRTKQRLIATIHRRKKMLRYLRRVNFERYHAMLIALGLPAFYLETFENPYRHKYRKQTRQYVPRAPVVREHMHIHQGTGVAVTTSATLKAKLVEMNKRQERTLKKIGPKKFLIAKVHRVRHIKGRHYRQLRRG